MEACIIFGCPIPHKYWKKLYEHLVKQYDDEDYLQDALYSVDGIPMIPGAPFSYFAYQLPSPDPEMYIVLKKFVTSDTVEIKVPTPFEITTFQNWIQTLTLFADEPLKYGSHLVNA